MDRRMSYRGESETDFGRAHWADEEFLGMLAISLADHPCDQPRSPDWQNAECRHS